MAQHDILWLNIPMVDAVLVQVGHRLENLPDYEGCSLLREVPNPFQFLIELPVASQFREHVEAILIIEEAVECYDIGMAAVAAYLNLPDNLAEHVLTVHQFFFDALQRGEYPSFGIPDHEYAAGLTRPQLPDKLEIFYSDSTASFLAGNVPDWCVDVG